ncbi:hypothetical protein DSO57_1005634 [Entomophthora muscae]|uniref:Uncharacterized protein n=1 Tax=Entomophthora muscae TaxID=34485 RepID=A0ACC2S9Q5_9FUNG|nr:hypothetical protein DSO57_1005634 [Entomophthora muscae]
MKFTRLLTIVGCLLTRAYAKDDEPGTAAKTDTSKFGGTYSFVYYYNQDPTATPTTQLRCKNSTAFKLKFPEDESEREIERDLGPLKADPIYSTAQGSWTVMEAAKGNGHDVLKINLYINDETEIIACWAIRKNGHNIIASINPRNLSQCPLKLIPITETCTIGRATLVGTCISGACNGTRTTTTSSFGLEHGPYFLLLLISFTFLLI